MSAQALAHGPWALLHSADLMRQLLSDCYDALKEAMPKNDSTSQLYGTYTARKPRPTHNRPLPLPDALLQGAPSSNPDELDVDWIKRIVEEPWLWQLQWATLSVLFVSEPYRNLLELHCPQHVATHWLRPLEERLYQKMLGKTTTDDFPDEYAARTPLMTVISELILLKMMYERR